MRFTTGIITEGGSRGSQRNFLTNKVNYSEQGTKSLYNRLCHLWHKPRGQTQGHDKIGQAKSRVLRQQIMSGSQMHVNEAKEASCKRQFCSFVHCTLTLWRRNYYFFLNFSTSCIQNVNNTGTKQVSIMKQTAF